MAVEILNGNAELRRLGHCFSRKVYGSPLERSQFQRTAASGAAQQLSKPCPHLFSGCFYACRWPAGAFLLPRLAQQITDTLRFTSYDFLSRMRPAEFATDA